MKLSEQIQKSLDDETFTPKQMIEIIKEIKKLEENLKKVLDISTKDNNIIRN